jgi:hypothetical protein
MIQSNARLSRTKNHLLNLSSIVDLKENMTVSFLLDTQLRWATIIACGQLWWLVKPLAGFLTLGGAGYNLTIKCLF